MRDRSCLTTDMFDPLPEADEVDDRSATPAELQTSGDGAASDEPACMRRQAARARHPAGRSRSQLPSLLRTPDAPEAASEIDEPTSGSKGKRRTRLNRSGLRMVVENDPDDAAAAEAHHRMKNEMQLLASSMAMRQRTRSAVGSPGAEDCNACVTQVLSVARLHDTLFHARGRDKVDLGAFLPGVCVQFAETFGLGSRMQMEIEISSEGAACSGRKAATIALITNEALTNAMKHGGSVSGSGHVRVAMKLKQRHALVEVSNDCCSASPPQGSPPQIIAALMPQIGGTADVEVWGGRYNLSCHIPLD